MEITEKKENLELFLKALNYDPEFYIKVTPEETFTIAQKVNGNTHIFTSYKTFECMSSFLEGVMAERNKTIVKVIPDLEFYVTVNPFTKKVKICSIINGVQFCDSIFYLDTDEWSEFELNGITYDIHFLYDEKFYVFISKDNKSFKVNLTIILDEN